MTASRAFRAAPFVAALLLTAFASFAQEVDTPPPAVAQKPAGFAPFTIVKEAERLAVEDQGSTGTCWSFATTSFLESEVARIQKKSVDLSEIWWARAAIVEKARRYVAAGGGVQFGEGGLAHDLTLLMGDYGAVPQSVYTGLADGKAKHAHQELFATLNHLVKGATGETGRAARGDAASRAAGAAPKAGRPKTPSPAFIRAVAGVVDGYLGAPPATFQYEGRTYDSRTFAAEFLKLVPGDYVEVMSYGATPFGGKAKLVVPDNWLQFDQYENLGIDAFMKGMNAALEAGFTVALDCDVSEKGFKNAKAVATMSDEEEKNPALVTQARRDEMFKKGETQDDHLMHVVGVAKHEDGRRFYLTKNSWGVKAGPYGGYFFLSEAYVRAKALSYMVHKDALLPAQ